MGRAGRVARGRYDHGERAAPAGTVRLAIAGVGFTAVGLMSLAFAVLGLGAFNHPESPAVYALVVGPLAGGALDLWLLRRLRAGQVAASRDRR